MSTCASVFLLSVIRIGKKSKDKAKEKETGDNKSVNITRDGITRIICTAKDSSDHFSGVILTYLLTTLLVNPGVRY